MATPSPWSHSSLAGFDTCPRQFEEVRVLKHFKDVKNAASLWGDEVHNAFDKYLKVAKAGLATPTLPMGMEQYADYLQQFIDRPGNTLSERKYALTRQLTPCDFFAKNVWGRGIIDVLTLHGAVAHVDDHKTGKNRKKDMQQLIIFALMTFYHHPEVQTVHCAYHWLQLGYAKDCETFYRHQIPELWAHVLPVMQRYRDAFHAGVFPPKPSGLCRKFCAVTSCEFHGTGGRR